MMPMPQEIQKEPKKIHPQKFALWIAIGSIIMMFGGFTSGFIVRKSQGNWLHYKLPVEFYISTGVVILSSLAIHLAVKSFKSRKMAFHKNMVALSLFLGVAFVVLQYFGFKDLYGQFKWDNNVSFQFITVIVLMHALHIAGGVAALIILFLRTFGRRVKIYSPVGIDMVAAYWHFVDILWLYLFVFFLLNQ